MMAVVSGPNAICAPVQPAKLPPLVLQLPETPRIAGRTYCNSKMEGSADRAGTEPGLRAEQQQFRMVCCILQNLQEHPRLRKIVTPTPIDALVANYLPFLERFT